MGVVDHIEDRIVGLKVRDLYEVPAAEILLTAHRELEKLVGTIHQNRFKRGLDEQWAFLVYAGLWYEPLREDLDAYMDSVNEQVTGEITMRLYKGRAGRWRAARPTRSTTRRWPASASPAACSPSRRARASSSSGACSRGWLTVSATGERRRHDLTSYSSLGWIVWQIGSRVAKPKMAQNRVKLGAAGVVALVLVGGVLAARAGDDAVKKLRAWRAARLGRPGAGSRGLAAGSRKRVPIVISRWATPSTMKKAVGAVSSEKPAMKGAPPAGPAST